MYYYIRKILVFMDFENMIEWSLSYFSKYKTIFISYLKNRAEGYSTLRAIVYTFFFYFNPVYW